MYHSGQFLLLDDRVAFKNHFLLVMWSFGGKEGKFLRYRRVFELNFHDDVLVTWQSLVAFATDFCNYLCSFWLHKYGTSRFRTNTSKVLGIFT